ncbi:hypothetical protein LTR78_009886 [Recurvomyces mirabilis]|uniref:Uncharacterized protein n=1 Tax=Recurvomyces mirabilis TaxID=574656 RepID=A0AAE0TT31_9PEZI|nr:hypothetical protein LTR78_009886 [Recurvomyces mirabilis]KAK5150561.1 hypothetical protein LTS14_010055 [Recurvomyces mirabilis]
MAFYKSKGPVDCNTDFDTSNVQGKTAIITGGASGIGLVYVRTLLDAGAAHVVIADINESIGKKLVDELSAEKTTFVRCDVTSWAQQAATFKKAREVSPTGRIDIVVANAGIVSQDDISEQNDLEAEEPKEPNIKVTYVNTIGVIYTAKLAMWYFTKQYSQAQGKKQEDQVLVLQASIAGYVDLAGVAQYTSSKFAVRGLMRSLRQTAGMSGARVNLIAPWYIDTAIIPDESRIAIKESGTGFAELADVGPTLLRIVADKEVHGRALAVFPRSWPEAPRGYVDLDADDLDKAGSFWAKAQEKGMAPAVWGVEQMGKLPMS